jgi:hypothetical protein
MFLILVGAAASVPASADTLYSNGPANDNFSGWTINYGYAMSDSFTLSQASTITGASFDVWLYPTDSLLSVDWSIGTSNFDSSIGSGTATTNNTFDFYNEYGYSINSESFSGLDLSLAAGTYYFSLYNASTANGGPAYWDVNNGPSTAYENTLGNVNGFEGYPGTWSDTFAIQGNTAVTPEPTSFLLLGSGLVGLAGIVKRKMKLA